MNVNLSTLSGIVWWQCQLEMVSVKLKNFPQSPKREKRNSIVVLTVSHSARLLLQLLFWLLEVVCSLWWILHVDRMWNVCCMGFSMEWYVPFSECYHVLVLAFVGTCLSLGQPFLKVGMLLNLIIFCLYFHSMLSILSQNKYVTGPLRGHMII